MDASKSNGKPVLGIDLDGTLADSIRVFLRDRKTEAMAVMPMPVALRNAYTGTKVAFQESVCEAFAAIWGNWASVPLVDPKIPQYVASLSERYNVRLVTATSGGKKDVMDWMYRHGIQIKDATFTTFLQDKHQHCDILVDDMLCPLNNMVRNGKKGILLNRDWSHSMSDELQDRRIEVFDSWQEIHGRLMRG